jgi:hypothetical protein
MVSKTEIVILDVSEFMLTGLGGRWRVNRLGRVLALRLSGRP